MKAWLGLAFVAMALTFGAPAAGAGTKAVSQAKAQAAFDATDFSARRAYRRYPVYPSYARYPTYPSYARYPSYPTYFARPSYYRPYPYSVPAPFFLGFGYLPYY